MGCRARDGTRANVGLDAVRHVRPIDVRWNPPHRSHSYARDSCLDDDRLPRLPRRITDDKAISASTRVSYLVFVQCRGFR